LTSYNSFSRSIHNVVLARIATGLLRSLAWSIRPRNQGPPRGFGARSHTSHYPASNATSPTAVCPCSPTGHLLLPAFSHDPTRTARLQHQERRHKQTTQTDSAPIALTEANNQRTSPKAAHTILDKSNSTSRLEMLTTGDPPHAFPVQQLSSASWYRQT